MTICQAYVSKQRLKRSCRIQVVMAKLWLLPYLTIATRMIRMERSDEQGPLPATISVTLPHAIVQSRNIPGQQCGTSARLWKNHGWRSPCQSDRWLPNVPTLRCQLHGSRLSFFSPDPVKQKHAASSVAPITCHSEFLLRSQVHPEHRSSSVPQQRTWDPLSRRILAEFTQRSN